MPQRVKTVSARDSVRGIRTVSPVLTDARRGTAASRGYGGKWQRARQLYLASHPVCVCCAANGVPVPAELIDHVQPHRGDRKLFWSTGNWQSLCAWCHNNLKQAIELAVERGEIAARFLSLDRTVAGWMHPRQR